MCVLINVPLSMCAARSVEKGEEAVKKLEADGLRPVCVQLDVCSKDSIEAAKKMVEEKYGHLDVLVNNAGILLSVSTQSCE